MIRKNNRSFKRIVLFVLLFAPLMLFAQISLTFQVLDIDTQMPIEGATSDYYGQYLCTDDRGYVEFELSSEECKKLYISEKK